MCSKASTTATETVQITTPDGPILAIKDEDLIYARGVPYANAGRFQVAQPAEWRELRDCTKPAPICPQIETPLDIVWGDLLKGRTQSEDCLTVSVAAPLNASGLPVMVYLHGGAYMVWGGDLDCHNTKGLARNGVVTVNVTYRMGVFGYVPIPDVAPANLGLLDQIEALRWVQRNITTFGGDPSKVTVFGQSAGGDSIVAMLAAEVTKGLFHRAIIQSTPMGILFQGNYNGAASAMGDRVKEKLSASTSVTTTELLDLQHELIKIATTISPGIKVFGPVYGQYPLPVWSQFEEQIRFRATETPVFIGYAHNEGTALNEMYPQYSEAWFDKSVFEDPTNWFIKILTDAVGNVPTYDVHWSPKGSRFGACHCMDLPMLLGGYEEWKESLMMQGEDAKQGVERIAPQMKNLWIAFADGENLGGKRYVIDEQFQFAPSKASK